MERFTAKQAMENYKRNHDLEVESEKLYADIIKTIKRESLTFESCDFGLEYLFTKYMSDFHKAVLEKVIGMLKSDGYFVSIQEDETLVISWKDHSLEGCCKDQQLDNDQQLDIKRYEESLVIDDDKQYYPNSVWCVNT